MECGKLTQAQACILVTGDIPLLEAIKLRRHARWCPSCCRVWRQTQELWTELGGLSTERIADETRSAVLAATSSAGRYNSWSRVDRYFHLGGGIHIKKRT